MENENEEKFLQMSPEELMKKAEENQKEMDEWAQKTYGMSYTEWYLDRME